MITGPSNGLHISFILIGSCSACWFSWSKGWQCRIYIVSSLTIIPLANVIFHVLTDRKGGAECEEAFDGLEGTVYNQLWFGAVWEFHIISTEKWVLLKILISSRGKRRRPRFQARFLVGAQHPGRLARGSLVREVQACCPSYGSQLRSLNEDRVSRLDIFWRGEAERCGQVHGCKSVLLLHSLRMWSQIG